ncbi:iron ABC transporter permease [Brucella sp. TWI432]
MILDVAIDGRTIIRLHNGLALRQRDLLAGAALFLIMLALIILSLNVGDIHVGLTDILPVIFGQAADHDQNYAILTVRLPRIILGFMAGWSAALAGAVLQSVARNPLAEPGLFGISAGSMTMILILLAFAPAAPKAYVVLAALGGGLAVTCVLLLLVGRGHVDGLAILLMGIAVGTVLTSVDSFLLLYLPAELSYNLASWMAGSLFQANWETILFFLPLIALSIIGIVIFGAALNCYELGNHLAMALGEPVHFSRPVILFFAVLLSASSVTAVGPLSFLGILAPQLTGFLTGATGRARLFLAALMGGNLVIAADILTRLSFGGRVSLPLGLSFTLIGVPLFLAILRLRSFYRKRQQ